MLVLISYGLALLLLFFFNCGQLSLTLIYLRSAQKRKHIANSDERVPTDTMPRVTLQLPIYNEVNVVERLIDAVGQLQYPKDKLDIQLLDDSSDETVALLASKVSELRQLGFDVERIHRVDRKGFKAGALTNGLSFAKGDLIAIFDADFVPDPTFLKKVISHFSDSQVAIVQTRWEHLNEGFSLMTQLQAFGLNAHFTIEQGGRFAAGLLANFSGSAGVWRKAAIVDAGGWQSDTLTEDLDLSYRAQLKGWKVIYREDIGSPGELPITMNALKSQQQRWMKGAAECARKLIGQVFRSSSMSLTKKLHAFLHLFGSSTFLLMFLLSLLSVPLLYIRSRHPEWESSFLVIDLFQANVLIIIMFYCIPHWLLNPTKRVRLIWYFPIYSALMMGLSLNNTIAVIEGFSGYKTAFIRTPKFNIRKNWQDSSIKAYQTYQLSWLIWAEGCLTVYFFSALMLAISLNDFHLFFLHLLLVIGFGMVFVHSLTQARFN